MADSAAANGPLYTCLTCRLGFRAPEHQRTHYASDFHRYNAKRKVAELPPVTPEVFDSKVMERRAAQKAQETAAEGPSRQFSCKPCGKTFGSQNAQLAHLASKKHKEIVSKVSSTIVPSALATSDSAPPSTSTVIPSEPTSTMDIDAPITAPVDPIAARLAASIRLTPESCLFCPLVSSTLEDNLAHMLRNHGFFIPDAEYLVDPAGLITQLGEDISVGNECIYCGTSFGGKLAGQDGESEQVQARGGKTVDEKTRARRALEAVRKHMVDKGHCKIAWDTEAQRLALSDHYDFTSSYGPADSTSDVDMADAASDDGNEDWEDLDGASSGSEDLPASKIRYGDSPFELVLPSGRRIGHRSLKYIYAQNLQPYYKEDDEKGQRSGLKTLADKVRRRKERQSQALIPAKGAGWGKDGEGEVIRVRNAGEARRAEEGVKKFKEQRRKYEFETKRGYKGNNQKHFRDPLLQ